MTLQTKDLRLNNLLEVDGVIIQVGKIEENHITWNLSKKDKLRVWNPFLPINDGRIKPIPLTEEWLLKFGFDFKEPILISAWKFSEVGETIITRCQYVHQLQNLYFALTGEELVVSDAVS